MQEWLYIAIMGISGILFSAGGTQVNEKIGGQKWLRRILLPVLLGICIEFVFKVDTWKTILFVLTSMAVFSLGYGDKAPWFSFKKFFYGFVFPFESGYPKVFTALCMPLPILFIGWTPLILGYPLFFLGMFFVASKSKWKIFEFFAGAGFGACLIATLK